MAEDKESGEAAKPQASAEAKAESKSDAKSDLPKVESPPLSPAGEVVPLPTPAADPVVAPEPEEKIMAKPAPWRLRMKARHKRHVLLAASVALAAGIGAIVGALAVSGINTPRPAAANLPERQAMAQSIDKLNHEIAALKADIEAGSKSARSQIAKISDKIGERLNHAPAPAPDVTGSIARPPAAIPTPVPRPDIRTTVVRGWSIYDVRDGFVSVREGHGDIYQVVLGAPLPGLGPVQQIKRQDGRWVVTTPKGLIVSQRDRRFFEPN
jgi:hypothetical protein